MKKQNRVVPTIHGRSVKRIAQAAAVVLLTCSARARANDCAGGMDASGNDCNDERSVPSLGIATPSPIKARLSASNSDKRIVFAKRSATHAQTRLDLAKQRQSEVNADVKIAEASLNAAHKAVTEAENAARH